MGPPACLWISNNNYYCVINVRRINLYNYGCWVITVATADDANVSLAIFDTARSGCVEIATSEVVIRYNLSSKKARVT